MNMRTKLILRMMPFLARRFSPLRAIDLTKYLYLKWLLDKYRIQVVFDVGGNVGQFARALRRLGYRGRIVSFEPQSRSFAKIAAAARADRGWEVHNHALGATPVRKPINLMASDSMSSFHRPSAAQIGDYAALNAVVGTEDVEIKRFDDVAVELGLADQLGRTLLKCDTQGFDLEVLKGAGNRLADIPLLMLEMSSIGLYEHAPAMSEMLHFLDERGFVPISFFPASALPDASVPEFDYLGLNRKLAAAKSGSVA